jgi:integrase
MSNETTPKTWQRTSSWPKGLLRHAKTKRFYARFTLAGKNRFEALGTTELEVARRRFADRKAAVERVRKASRKAKAGVATMAELIALERAAIVQLAEIGPKSRELRLQSIAFIEKTWPGFASLRPDEITTSAVHEWRNRALSTGTGFRPPGAKTTGTAGRSPSIFNKGLATVRRMLDRAVENGALHANVLVGKRGLRAKDRPKKPDLPSPQRLQDVFTEIERIGGRGIEAANFCRGLAFTGCRQREASALVWADVDFTAGVVRVRGTKTDAGDREVPLIPAARELFERIRRRRQEQAETAIDGIPFIDPKSRVFRVREALKSLTRACAAVGIPRLTHHDLRDFFATQAIQAGVPVPTVADWLGHADEGVTLLARYKGVATREHSVAQAAKVSFGGAS